MTSDLSRQKKRSRFVTLCGRIFRDADPAHFPRLEYRGRTIYLCTEACLDAFRADPDVFYKAHRNSDKGKEHPEPRVAPTLPKNWDKI